MASIFVPTPRRYLPDPTRHGERSYPSPCYPDMWIAKMSHRYDPAIQERVEATFNATPHLPRDLVEALIIKQAFSWKLWSLRERATSNIKRFKDDLKQRGCVSGVTGYHKGPDGEQVADVEDDEVMDWEDFASAEEMALLAKFDVDSPSDSND